jgi:hypothetical protein
MAITTQERITRELARLRMWQSVASPDELIAETKRVHDQINQLLDLLEAEAQSEKVVHAVTK